MKKLTTLTLGLLLILGSCAKDEETSTVMNDSTGSSLELKSLKDGNGELFTYSTVQESTDKLIDAVKTLAEDGTDEITARGIDAVVSVVEVGNGKGLLTKVYFCDTQRNIVVDRLEIDPITGQLGSVGVDEPILDENENVISPALGWLMGLHCPLGYTEIANCPFSMGPSGVAGCMTMGIGSFNDNNSGNGTNAYIVTNNFTGISICAIGGQ